MFALNIPNAMTANESSKSIIEDIMSEGFVWAVPKRRRTVERRLVRRFGVPKYPQSCQIIRPKDDITVCDNCGHYHEIHTLCGNCYEKVKQETKLILEDIRKQFKSFEPIEQEVAIFYKNEPKDDNLEGKRIVEMDRQRPEWFAKNLLSKAIKSKKWTETNVIVKEEEPKIKD
jgi:large subunit ribosomal protein L32